jgi:hypothetical protein
MSIMLPGNVVPAATRAGTRISIADPCLLMTGPAFRELAQEAADVRAAALSAVPTSWSNLHAAELGPVTIGHEAERRRIGHASLRQMSLEATWMAKLDSGELANRPAQRTPTDRRPGMGCRGGPAGVHSSHDVAPEESAAKGCQRVSAGVHPARSMAGVDTPWGIMLR